MRLAGKVALVTGGSRGSGRATVLACGRAGARVVLGDHTTAGGAAETVRQIRDTGALAALVGATVARFGRLAIYVNNANAGPRAATRSSRIL